MNRQVILAIGLGVVALLVVGKQLAPVLFGAASAPPPPPPPATQMPALTDIMGGAEDEAEDVTSPYSRLIAQVDHTTMNFQVSGLRNPFRPLVGPGSLDAEQTLLDDVRRLAQGLPDGPEQAVIPATDFGYKIRGIVWDEGTPLALVNDQVLAVGEEIEEGGIITAITQDSVMFMYEGHVFTLFVDEEE